MTAHAPAEFFQMGLDPSDFKRSDSKSFRGPCPRCGGVRRFVVWVDKPFPKFNYACDGCGIKGWADQLNTALRQPVSDELKREWEARNERERKAREQTRREKLSQFTTAELWAELHDRMTGEHIRWWESQGVPRTWQDYLQLGYVSEKTYRSGDELKVSPAYSIPYFHECAGETVFKTIQYRLSSPDNPADRYRFETGLGTAYYSTTPTLPVGELAIICEGAKKAMVTRLYAADEYTVLAIPSKSDFAGVVEAVRTSGRVYVMLDPDADNAAHKLAGQVGDSARVVTLTEKADDMMVKYGARKKELAAYLRQAR